MKHKRKVKSTPGTWELEHYITGSGCVFKIKMGTALDKNRVGYEEQHKIEVEFSIHPESGSGEKEQYEEAKANMILMSNASKLYYMTKELRNILSELPTHDGESSPYVEMADALLAEIEGNE